VRVVTAIRRVFQRPRLVFSVLVPTLVATWFLAGVGGDRTPSDGGLYYVGAGFWVCFGAVFVTTVLYTLVQLVRVTTGRSRAH
jgi:hypothetical protein